MRNLRWMYLIIALLALVATNDAVWARGGHHHHHGGGHHYGGHGHRHNHLNLGISMGGYYNNPAFWGSGFYGYRSYGYPGTFFNAPIYNYPPAVRVPATPPVYIQQEQPRPVQPRANYWYYCQNPEGYYPYVKACPGGWLQVAPQPPAQ